MAPVPGRTPPNGARRLRFACVPHFDDDDTRLVLADFCHALSHHAVVPVEPHRAPSPAALAAAFGAGRAEIAWVSPVLYLTSASLREAVPLVSSIREGGATYHSVVFTEKESPIKSPSDLTNARMAWVAKSSASGYLVPRLALAARGIRPAEYFSEELFLDSHGAVANAVLGREADAGATFASFENGDPTKRILSAGFDGAVPGRSARVLLAAGPIPADLVVASPSVPAPVRAALVTALQEIAEDPLTSPLCLRIFNARAFQPFEPGALDALLADVDTGRSLGLLDEL